MGIRKYYAFVFCVLAGATTPMWAQDSMRAIMKGNSNSDRGKCTIEVNVDDVAEVEVSGDMGRMRTLAGQPSQWRRFECNSLMPRRPNDFRFTGIDGRGRMTLVRDPRDGGPAVIRIEDPKGGYEGYTFDLEWRGGSDDYNRPGYGPGDRPGYGDNRPGYGDNRPGYGNGRPGYGDNRPGYGNGRAPYIVSCSSDDGRRRYCQANTARGVRIVKQYNNACRRDGAWGFDSRGIWVDRGCRADFEVQP